MLWTEAVSVGIYQELFLLVYIIYAVVDINFYGEQESEVQTWSIILRSDQKLQHMRSVYNSACEQNTTVHVSIIPQYM